MLKREAVWQRIADDIITGRRSAFHQIDLAAELGMSVGNVNLAIEPLRAIGAVEVVHKYLVVRDLRKMLLVWASRRVREQPAASFALPDSPSATMRLLPPGLILTSFAGYIARFGEEPAPFSTISGYAGPGDDRLMAELSARFSTAPASRAGILVYRADPGMTTGDDGIVGLPQMYIDLWSESDFFAADYLRNLEREMGL